MPLDRSASSAEEPRILTVGRINLDLYVEELGVPMHRASSFLASVGGSPTNTAIVAARLGVPTALLSAEGGDPAGRLVRSQLAQLGVDVRWLQTVAGGATSLALLATPQPDAGERQFYRDHPADSLLDIALVDDLPWSSLAAVVLSADALARGTTPALVRAIAAAAARRGVAVWWDLDLRESSWPEPDQYARIVLPALRGADVVIGTEQEFTMLLQDATRDCITRVRALGIPVTVLKRGAHGVQLIRPGHEDMNLPARSTTPVCTVGGGDATAGALVAARVQGRSWYDALQVAMIVAGWTVEQPYCSTGFPTHAQLIALGVFDEVTT